ncbi:succinic semialdehyde dehydrogenase [Salpingoeca rosetta]|uniref:Succinate-semialdehyde dehydrogenase n=1 Tax=Salpingoeca rosetta (strain ATCC 50818 / BSB-021) TaxID=946362 RepID=F2U7B6_SALR5|nr:succinic semialdehyde dehydrogenase [Salpingoeca rosetta]EGD83333.1 succinic semialdehyde dehydrogenase [Salpingoeca rosetta]|eukprot:XP_004994837.1 succinic semialdehyde dehydrogenase [Salpingoeca rosetta]
MHPTVFSEPQPHTFTVFNPSTQESLAHVPDSSLEQTRNIIDRSLHAFSSWRHKTARERSQLLRKWADLLTHNTDYLAGVMTLEQGKPLAEARGEVTYGTSFVYWFAEEAIRSYGDVHPPMAPNQRIMVWKQPVGVAACITPWNFPLAMITRKAGAALAAGCTMIVKPSAETPLTALAMAELAYQAGIPEDVLPVITASHETSPTVGKELATNPKVSKLSFTGSTAVGKQLLGLAANNVKRVSMELGGNAPFIVFDDADIDAAVSGAIASKFRNAGQTCVCANRFFVQSGVYDEFMTKLKREIEKLPVGDGFKDGVAIGPLINEAAVRNVTRLVIDAQRHGARILAGGMKHPLGGNFFYPTLVADVKAQSQLFCEEIFGPIAAVSKFTSDDDIVRMANSTHAGLVAYFYSQDLRRIWKTAELLEYGMVGVNTGIISTEVAPFGGVKESGMGREGSRYGMAEYEELKYVLLDMGKQFGETTQQ